MGGILLFLCGILSVLQCANSVRLVLQLHLEFIVFLSLKEKKKNTCAFFLENARELRLCIKKKNKSCLITRRWSEKGITETSLKFEKKK